MSERLLFDPPLFGQRHDDRTHSLALSPMHQAFLSVPPTGGRIRLIVTVPWAGPPGPSLHVLPITLTWQKTLELPQIGKLAEIAWCSLRHDARDRTERPRVNRYPLKVDQWRGDAYVWKTDHMLLANLPKDDAITNLGQALTWAARILRCRRRPKKDRRFLIKYAHRLTALLVADEVAQLYVTNREISEFRALKEAESLLRRRVRRAYGPNAGLTPRRLGLALVDQAFGDDLPLLLARGRAKLDDGHLWSRLVPPDVRERLRKQLWPAATVRELLDAHDADDDRVRWLTRWWCALRDGPGLALLVGKLPAPERAAASAPQISVANVMLRIPGAEAWSERVLEAVYS